MRSAYRKLREVDMATKKQKQMEEEQRRQSRREISGVCLIAAGLFFAVSIYSDAVGVVGSLISKLFFMLFGLLGFAAPVFFFVFGLLLIVFSAKPSHKSMPLLLGLAMLFLLLAVHVYFRANVQDVSLFAYYKEAYRLALEEHRGGGLIGALPAYPLLLLLGEVGTYILCFTLELVIVLLLTRISLRNTGEKVGKSIKSGGEKMGKSIKSGVENARGYVEAKQQEKARSSAAHMEDKDLFSPDLLHNIMDTPGTEKHRGSVRRSRSQSADMRFDLHMESKPDPDMVGAHEQDKVRYTGDELSYMPAHGLIEKRKENWMEKESKLEQDLEDVLSSFAAPAPPPREADMRTRISSHAPSMAMPTMEPIAESVAEAELPPWEESILPAETKPFAEAEDFWPDAPAETEEDEEFVFLFPEGPEEEIGRMDEGIKGLSPAQEAFPESIPMTPAAPMYQFPPLSLLRKREARRGESGDSPEAVGKLLVDTLASFHISARILNITVGPVITRFELQPAQGIRVNRITTLSNDIALALAAPRVRIEAPIPGKAAIGIEIPNKNVTSVFLREVLESPAFTQASSKISFALGKDIAGKTMVADLAKMPHLLIAGATGSGKSVCINGIITSLVYKSSPEDVRMILIDPKVVELKVFSSLPHLYLPVVTEPKKAAGALKWAVVEMEQRYQKMSKCNARDLARYNALQSDPEERMPLLVIVIDELADLMMVAAKDVEESICRIAQLGRACGIHLIVATQRPSADIITGLIKANIPSRIAFMVSSAIDSRVIMDCNGAEKLLGKGDMIFHANGADKPVRVQGAYVSDEEVEAIMDFFQGQMAAPSYKEDNYMEVIQSTALGTQGNGKQEDELLPEAVKIVLESGQASISMIQRRLRVGYARAARLIDIMEQHKIVSGFEGSKPRRLLIASYEEFLQMEAGTGEEEA